MTRKHFKALAAAMKYSRPSRVTYKRIQDFVSRYVQWVSDVKVVAETLSMFNTGFNRDRFMEACGFSEADPEGRDEAAKDMARLKANGDE